MQRVDAFGNSLGVCRKLTEGIGSLPGWHKGVRQKKTKTHRKIVGGSRKAYRESNYGRINEVTTRWWADSPKESGSSLRMRSEIAEKKTGGLAARLPEVAEYAGNPGDGQQLSTGKPPRWQVNRPYHRI
ncbi:hypothetical protein GW17_00042478 [Ensete ventricosum]|nr:hypothetical protein GW17_00042478 [Ensete ventricosum]